MQLQYDGKISFPEIYNLKTWKQTYISLYPNLQTKKFFVPETGEWVVLKVSANALRTINKKGISAVLAEAKSNGNILV